MKKTSRRIILHGACAAVLLAWGCSPDDYRASADRQVFDLLKGRERSTLQYTPEVSLKSQPPPAIAKRAYERVPFTSVAPASAPALEPPHPAGEFGPLGPSAADIDVPGGADSSVSQQASEVEAIREAAGTSLTYGPAAPTAGSVRLDLFGALRYAVQNSRNYQNQMEDLYLSALDVTLERHLFEPRPFARTGLQFAGGQQDSSYRAALTATANAGVRQRLPYGGEIVAETLVQFVSALNDNTANGESVEFALSGSVPLLRGAGLVNLEPLIQSERALVYAVRDFEDFRRSFVVNTAQQYFNLLSTQQSVANRLQSYADRAQLLERARAVFAAGRQGFSYLEVQRAEQNLLFAENGVINAQENYQNSLDRFKIFLGMPIVQELEVVPVELDVNVPELQDKNVLELAQKFRLDLQTARDRTQDARRRVSVAENGLLPDLSLNGQGSVGNRNETPGRAVDARRLEYSAGITLDLPLDRLAERNAYRQALIRLDQSQRDLEDVRAQVIVDVRQSQRAIKTSRSSLEIARVNIRLAERRLELANIQLQQGINTNTRDVVEAQDALLQALDDYERAQADFQIEILRFLRNTGMLRVDPASGEIGRALSRDDTGSLRASADVIGRQNRFVENKPADAR